MQKLMRELMDKCVSTSEWPRICLWACKAQPLCARVTERMCVHLSPCICAPSRAAHCLPVSCSPSSPPPEGHSAPLSASNPVCPGEIEGSGRPLHTRGAANTITSLSQTLNGALRLFNKAKRGRRDQFNTRPDSNGKRVNK